MSNLPRGGGISGSFSHAQFLFGINEVSLILMSFQLQQHVVASLADAVPHLSVALNAFVFFFPIKAQRCHPNTHLRVEL